MILNFTAKRIHLSISGVKDILFSTLLALFLFHFDNPFVVAYTKTHMCHFLMCGDCKTPVKTF